MALSGVARKHQIFYEKFMVGSCKTCFLFTGKMV